MSCQKCIDERAELKQQLKDAEEYNDYLIDELNKAIARISNLEDELTKIDIIRRV